MDGPLNASARPRTGSEALASCLLVTAFFFVASGIASADSWNYLNGVHGRGYVVCDAILKRLNDPEWRIESTSEENVSVGQVVLGYPGWRDPPWQNLNLDEHRGLIRELLKYHSLGADVYFGLKQPQQTSDYQAAFDQSIEDAARRVTSLRVWRTHLVNWLDDKPAPVGNQTVVNLTYSASADESFAEGKPHPDGKAARNTGISFLVTDDLRGPDRRISEWDQRNIATTLLFDGIPHFLTVLATGRTVAIDRDFGTGPTSFCELVLSTDR